MCQARLAGAHLPRPHIRQKVPNLKQMLLHFSGEIRKLMTLTFLRVAVSDTPISSPFSSYAMLKVTHLRFG